MQSSKLVFAAALSLTAPMVWAAQGEAGAGDEAGGERLPESAQITVAGYRHQVSFDYAMFLKGAETFVAHHGLAPAASLRFSARDPRHAPLTDLKLALVDDEDRLALPLDREDSFALPAGSHFKAEGSWIVANRKSGNLDVYPRVMSPEIPDDQRRLGDLRLECEVMWAMRKDSAPLFIRVAAKMTAGICHSHSFALNKQVARKLAAAQLVEGDRKKSLPLAKSGYAYIPPLYDRSWSDDARVVLEFAR